MASVEKLITCQVASGFLNKSQLVGTAFLHLLVLPVYLPDNMK